MKLIENIRVLGLGFICSIALSTYALANDHNVTKKNVPQSIILSFEKSYPNAKALNYSKETVKGKTTYEVESKDGNTKRDLTYSSSGALLEIEEVISLRSLPKDVIQKLNKSYPKANIVTIEKITRGNNISYGVEIKKNNKIQELNFTSGKASKVKENEKNESKEKGEKNEGNEK